MLTNWSKRRWSFKFMFSKKVTKNSRNYFIVKFDEAAKLRKASEDRMLMIREIG